MADCAGFGLCVCESGRKGFVLIYRSSGRQRRLTIGTWPAWTVTTAREEAKRLKREIDKGEDPLDTRLTGTWQPWPKQETNSGGGWRMGRDCGRTFYES